MHLQSELEKCVSEISGKGSTSHSKLLKGGISEPVIFRKHFTYTFKKVCTISEFILSNCPTGRAVDPGLYDAEYGITRIIFINKLKLLRDPLSLCRLDLLLSSSYQGIHHKYTS
jgi:hypothetical protein